MTPSFSPYLVGGVFIYLGVCGGLIAQKHGKNPLLYGLITVISPFNLIMLGVWAFGRFESKRSKAEE